MFFGEDFYCYISFRYSDIFQELGIVHQCKRVVFGEILLCDKYVSTQTVIAVNALKVRKTCITNMEYSLKILYKSHLTYFLGSHFVILFT